METGNGKKSTSNQYWENQWSGPSTCSGVSGTQTEKGGRRGSSGLGGVNLLSVGHNSNTSQSEKIQQKPR